MESRKSSVCVRTLAAAGAMALGSLAATSAEAQIVKSGDLTISGNIAGTTDYIFRGFSQTRRDPSLQGNLDATYKWFYVGMFLSHVDFADDAGGLVVRDNGRNVANVETDLYAGVKIPLGKMFELDAGVIGYIYPGARDGKAGQAYQELDYVEAKLGGTFKPIDPLAFTLFGFYSPEYTNKTGEVFTLEAGASYTFPSFSGIGTSVSALLGYQAGDDLRYKVNIGNGKDDYLYWNAGMTFTFAERFSIDLRYWDTNVKDNNAKKGFADDFCSGFVFQCDATFVATAKVTF